MPSIDLVTKYQQAVDELFSSESRAKQVSNEEYKFTGAHTIKVFSVSTSPLTDYDRSGAKVKAKEQWSRFGVAENLETSVQDMTLSRDRSFTFVIDKMDEDETQGALRDSTALAREIREVVFPEIDTHVFAKMAEGAGTKKTEALTVDNVYKSVLAASNVLDDADVPEDGRVLMVSPAVYTLMKQDKLFGLNPNVSGELVQSGIIATMDGARVMKVPAKRLPAKCGFILCHPIATLAPVKLDEYRTHDDPPGISGALCEGRFVYDAFVLKNKAKAIYYHAVS